jgi:hypothetical protein
VSLPSRQSSNHSCAKLPPGTVAGFSPQPAMVVSWVPFQGFDLFVPIVLPGLTPWAIVCRRFAAYTMPTFGIFL